jgi:hypothetical protein
VSAWRSAGGVRASGTTSAQIRMHADVCDGVECRRDGDMGQINDAVSSAQAARGRSRRRVRERERGRQHRQAGELSTRTCAQSHESSVTLLAASLDDRR